MTRMRLRAGACGEGKRTSLSLLATSGNRMTETESIGNRRSDAIDPSDPVC